MFAGINMFWARLRLILARVVRRGSKWALRRTQNIFMPKNINSVSIIIILEGIERINNEKMTTKLSEQSRTQVFTSLMDLFSLDEKRNWLEISQFCHLSYQKLWKMKGKFHEFSPWFVFTSARSLWAEACNSTIFLSRRFHRPICF